jgi:arylsulfatase A-like enzyme
MNRNVVLVCLDTVRKDYFDRFAPRLAAAANVRYEQCRAASAWSTPSHASMLTGRLPHEHGVHTHNRDFSTLSRADTVMADLDGYTAIGVSANLFAGPRYGFDTLFDRFTAVDPDVLFQDAWAPLDVDGAGVERYRNYVRAARERGQLGKYAANLAAYRVSQFLGRLPVGSLRDKGAAAATRESLRQIRATEGRFFLFLNLMDAHQPHYPFRGVDRSLHAVPGSWSSADDFYRVKWEVNRDGRIDENREFLDRFEQLYGASVDYLDRVVLEFVERVRAETDGETTFVITADHGENLARPADDDLFEHTSSLSEGLLHVPCVVVDAPVDGSLRVTDYVSHLQLRELLVGLAAGELPDVTRDRVAAEVIGISPGTVELAPDEESYFDRAIRAAYRSDRKYVWDSLGNRLAYRLDPGRPSWQEQVEAGATIPGWTSAYFDGDVADAKAVARDGPRATDRPEAVDAYAEARLRDLGYL